MDEKQRDHKMCDNCQCQAPSENNFKKVLGLRNSGLMIYSHKEKQTALKKRTIKPKAQETFILHNASDNELKRPDYIREMCQYRTKCLPCKKVIQRVRSLLDEITDIKRNDVIGVCEHCKRLNPSGKCRRCDYIVNKFLCNKVKVYEDRQKRFKSWISNVNQFLIAFVASENVCMHKSIIDSSSELEILLEELKSPLEMRQPDISFFPTESGPFCSMTESRDMLEEILLKLKSESFRNRSSDDSLFVSPSTTENSCKCFKDKKHIQKLEMDEPSDTLMKQKSCIEAEYDVTKNIMPKNKHIKKTPSKLNAKATYKETVYDVTKDIMPKDKNIKETSSKYNAKAISKEKPPKERKTSKPKMSSEEAMLVQLVKRNSNQREKKEKPVNLEKVKKKVESLPQLPNREVIEVAEVKTESVVECGHVDFLPTKMVKGKYVVPFNPNYKDRVPGSNVPLFGRNEAFFSESAEIVLNSSSIATTTLASHRKRNLQQQPRGVIKYELSNRDFIENGWTVLPKTKLMRRMNIYKMEPTNPQFDWFERHKYQEIMFYDTNEKLAKIEKSGRGKWFYRNGKVALDYYNAQEQNAGQRYVIYSSGDELENGKTKSTTVLATFDFLGNGVIYDHYGNVRLKYNQTEGVLVDEKIGPPGRWMWHSLNEPPILKPVFTDSYVKNDTCLKKVLSTHNEGEFNSCKQDNGLNPEMLAVEIENFVKEKAQKMLQKFEPYQIRMKVMKVNDHFSLRILDQSKIYLLFRDGSVTMKLNLGMLLINTDIIDIETTEMQVVTPCDRIPPKTSSVAQIQRTLNNARIIGKARNKAVSVKNSIGSKISI